jgi:hypothetical protein
VNVATLSRMGLTPERLLRLAMSQLEAAGMGADAAGALELLAGAALFGPPDAPPYLRQLIADTAARHGLPASVLAGVAAASSGYDPGYSDPGRVGLFGLARTAAGYSPEAHLAERGDLARRDPDAIAALLEHADCAAARLAELRRRSPAALAGALVLYFMEGGELEEDARERAALVGAVAVLTFARAIPGDAWDGLRGVLSEAHDEL